jgi:hypothetical protein
VKSDAPLFCRMLLTSIPGDFGGVIELDQRFWSKVDASGICWEWTASISKGGYGKFTIPFGDGTGRSKHVYAHRHSWEILVGPISDGLQVDHLCRNRKCVNPDHLEPVTTQVNCHRGVSPAALNVGKTHCPLGHEYNSENTFENRQGYRQCKVCRRAYDKRRYAAKGRR